MNTLEIQKALMAKGFNPGPLDGIMGAQTRKATRAFQAANGLVTDGIVGPVTTGKLFTTFAPDPDETSPVPVDLPWYAEAWRLNGVTEVGGAGNNQLILAWADALDIAYSEDETPWCGLFVGHCVGSQLADEPLPQALLMARAWRKFGIAVSKERAQPGAIMVFWRGSPDGSLGHVGFYAGEDKSAYHILGGNQSNKVCVTRVAKDRLLAVRWPATVPAPHGKPLLVSAKGKPLSQNEG